MPFMTVCVAHFIVVRREEMKMSENNLQGIFLICMGQKWDGESGKAPEKTRPDTQVKGIPSESSILAPAFLVSSRDCSIRKTAAVSVLLVL